MAKKIILGVVIAIAALMVLLAIIVQFQPSEFHVSRTVKVAATPAEVFEQVNDFHKWEQWSPWLKIDPQAKGTYEGPVAGEGAIFRWAGNAEVGEGSMEILESKPGEHVRIKLHFLKPFEDVAATAFQLQPEGELTAVTWSMDGHLNAISKLLCLFVMDMDAMIGEKYEEGLLNIKQIVEAPDPSPTESSEPVAEAAAGKTLQ